MTFVQKGSDPEAVKGLDPARFVRSFGIQFSIFTRVDLASVDAPIYLLCDRSLRHQQHSKKLASDSGTDSGPS